MLPQSMAVGILMTSNPLFRVRNNGISVVDISSTKELWFNVTLWKEYRLVTENKQGFYKNKFCYGRNRRRTPWRKHSFLKLNYICRKICVSVLQNGWVTLGPLRIKDYSLLQEVCIYWFKSKHMLVFYKRDGWHWVH